MSLGIPYMGSKRKLAGDILYFIKQRHGAMTDLYDLFGGGGSVSFTAIRDYRLNVHYNELNSHIFHLVEYLKTHKELEPKFYDWVTREEFFKQCSRTDADWYSGFVMSCWSFGNKQSSYIYGADIEEIKRLAHEYIVNRCIYSLNKLDVKEDFLTAIKGIQKRRLLFCKYISNSIADVFDRGVQNIEIIEHLARIQNLQNLQNLHTTNTSYESVQITGKTPIIYCDIPYKGTGEYKEGGFDYNRFYDWVKNCPHAVYISEYDAPFEEVHAFSHRSSLSATNNKKKTVEKIFWNGKGDAYNFKLF